MKWQKTRQKRHTNTWQRDISWPRVTLFRSTGLIPSYIEFGCHDKPVVLFWPLRFGQQLTVDVTDQEKRVKECVTHVTFWSDVHRVIQGETRSSKRLKTTRLLGKSLTFFATAFFGQFLSGIFEFVLRCLEGRIWDRWKALKTFHLALLRNIHFFRMRVETSRGKNSERGRGFHFFAWLKRKKFSKVEMGKNKEKKQTL